MDHKDIIELATLILSVLCSTIFLASRIQKIEDLAVGTKDRLSEHLNDDKDDFRRIWATLDRKADKLGSLHQST